MCVANLRLPSSIKAPWKRLLVEATIRDMGLTDAMHTYVGNWHLTGLSGALADTCYLQCVQPPRLKRSSRTVRGHSAGVPARCMI